jgi:hypothetical protein
MSAGQQQKPQIVKEDKKDGKNRRIHTRFPFTSESLLEVWLALPQNKTIFFNGKMARLALPSGEGKAKETGIAIRIVQISAEDERTLDSFIKAVAPQVVKKPRQSA